MKTLLITYHSITGGSKAMAQAVADGAATEPGVHKQLLHASDTNAEHVLNAHGYVFIAPETLGNMAGLMKDFFDRTYYPADLQRCHDLGAAFAGGLAMGLF